jgi:hypothetical protein
MDKPLCGYFTQLTIHPLPGPLFGQAIAQIHNEELTYALLN